jgi:hypothetical protein
MFNQCNSPEMPPPGKNTYKIVFLHHSTGNLVWNGKATGFDVIRNWFSDVKAVPEWFIAYNEKHGTDYYIEEQNFPKEKPYGWKNYPYDYYNIWVKNAGQAPYMEEPTLEMLTSQWDMIIFKHCFPVGNIKEDTGIPDIDSEEKRLENYKMQYEALKDKMHEFPETKFILWTGAALVERKTTPENAARTRTFFEWVTEEWDTPGDNIYIWDFYNLETEGGLYLKDEYARNPGNSHPSKSFAGKVAPLFCSRIVDVIQNEGTQTTLTGEKNK